MLPNIDIDLANGALGLTIATNDALSGMILQGPAPAGLALATPKLLNSLRDAEDVGITETYDTDNVLTAWRSIKEFYAEAGTGAELWIVVVSQAVDMATAFDKDENHAVNLLNAANGGIRMLTMVRNPASGYTPTIADGLDADVFAAITSAQALAEEFTAMYKPLRVIVPAYGYNGTASDLSAINTRSDNRVAVLLGDTVVGGNAAVGVLLGRLASVPVMRNPGRVASGALPLDEVYIGNETVNQAGADVETIDGRGYITFRRHVALSGFYFTNDPTATLVTDDYSSLARGRVIDKAISIAYRVYLQILLDEIRINVDTGRISTAQAKYLQSICATQIDSIMTANDEISGVTVQVDPNQNVLSTNRICVELRIIPVAYAKEIKIELGFQNPALQS